MDAKFTAIFTKIKEFFGRMSSKTKKLLIVGLGVLLVFAAGLAYFLNNKPYDVLFTGLNDQESSEIIGKLQESGVNYKYEEGTILVPEEQAETLKAQLVFEGYPKSGFTYDIFRENVGLMTTDSERETYKLYDLQKRMESTISLLQNVKSATVTIVPGEDKRYVLSEDSVTQASASVVVVMKDGGTPGRQLVEGIQRLVARGVPQLDIENVSVVDGNGIDVTVDTGSQSTSNRLKMEVEQEVEKAIKANIMNVLTPIYGAENLRISVKCSVDINKKIQESLSYSAPPNEEDKAGIPSQINRGTELSRDGNQVGGVAGAQANAEIPIYGNIQTDGTENYVNSQENIDFLVNQVKEQAQIDSGTLEDLNVSVAINGNNLGPVTRNDLLNLIGKAAGMNQIDQAEKIAIVTAPFYQPPALEEDGAEEETTGLNYWLIVGIGAGVFLLLILLLVFLLLRRKKKKRQQAEEEAAAAAMAGARGMRVMPGAAAAAGAAAPEEAANEYNNELLNIQNEKGLELKENIRQFAEDNPEISAQLIKSWLKGGEANG